jgi:hypothetical protein
MLRRAEDYPVSKLQPLYDYFRMLRGDDSPWDIWVEDLRYVGEVFATKDSPTLSAYQLADVPHGRRPALLVDRTGRPWGVKQHRGRKVGYRWMQISIYSGIHRAGIADYVLQARPRPPHPALRHL